MMQIPDPVHGYITLEGMYADIVNTPEFQRLRSIEQVSFRPSYPGARHDRFIHSLGTYHLAGRFVESFFRNLDDDVDDLALPEEKVWAQEEETLRASFLYAALLHDIGHAPFSHTTEDFFLLPKAAGTGLPKVWDELCAAVDAIDPREGQLFRQEKKEVGAPHEIVSALLLVANWRELTGRTGLAKLGVDLPLAARMVIGFPYKPADLILFEDESIPEEEQQKKAEERARLVETYSIRNCLIQMLNYSTLDVDRLDYMGRDSSLTGFLNAPLDLPVLAASVTAVRQKDGWLTNAYRDDALRVFDLMFQAKLSHDAWVIGSTASLYEAELLKHCIRGLNQRIHPDYMDLIFTPKALSREGIDLVDPRDPARRKRYRLLSDIDVSADLKSQTGGLYDELYTRELSKRRSAVWRSYYEYHHIFNAPAMGVTPDGVYAYFKPLLDHMADPTSQNGQNNTLVFDPRSYRDIAALSDEKITHPAKTLHEYLLGESENGDYSVVLLDQTNRQTMKLDPADIRFVFHKHNIPLRSDGQRYSTYEDLTGITADDRRSSGFFYLYRVGALGHLQLTRLRELLQDALMDARAKDILND